MIELRWLRQKPTVINGIVVSWDAPPVLQWLRPSEQRFDADTGEWVDNWRDVPEVYE